MKKSSFVALIMGTVSGVFFALGMCMALLPEWNAFNSGVVFGVVGAAVLLAMLIVRRKMMGKKPIKINTKTVMKGLQVFVFVYETKLR